MSTRKLVDNCPPKGLGHAKQEAQGIDLSGDHPVPSYYRARYYDPGTGRFLSEDPIGLDRRVTNFYIYATNDPIDSLDPTGLQTQHQKDGPDHFENIKCRPGDDCPMLLDKIQKWAQQISSHYLFDWKQGTGRHTTQKGPRGGPPDVEPMWNGYNNCVAMYLAKCEGDCPKAKPNRAPQPKPIGGPVAPITLLEILEWLLEGAAAAG